MVPITKDPTVSDVHVDRPLGKPKKKLRYLVQKRISGSSEIPLSPKGERLADRLGKRLAAKGGLDVLHLSPLKRAVQTAASIKQFSLKGSLELAEPSSDLQPWHLGSVEGRLPADVHHLLTHYIENPKEVPPGKGADGKPAESFFDAVDRQLGYLSGLYKDAEDYPTAKIGVIMHSRGMEVLQAWVDAGCPDDFEKLDLSDVLNPDDPEHADVLRWHKGEIKEVDLADDDFLKSGVYLIMHSLTADDTDDGNAELEKKLFIAPDEVTAAAKRAYDLGTVEIDITSTLAEGLGLSIENVRKIHDHFKGTVHLTEPKLTTDAWGGRHAVKWVERVIRKFNPNHGESGRFAESDSSGSGKDLFSKNGPFKDSSLVERKGSFTSSEAHAIETWKGAGKDEETTSEFSKINAAMKDRAKDSEYTKIGDHLHDAIQKGVVTEDTKVYRGLGLKNSPEALAAKGGVSSSGFQSTAPEFERAHSFAQDSLSPHSAVMEITVPKGTPALWLDHRDIKGEHELLLDRQTRYKFDGTYKRDGVTVIRATVQR